MPFQGLFQPGGGMEEGWWGWEQRLNRCDGKGRWGRLVGEGSLNVRWQTHFIWFRDQGIIIRMMDSVRIIIRIDDHIRFLFRFGCVCVQVAITGIREVLETELGGWGRGDSHLKPSKMFGRAFKNTDTQDDEVAPFTDRMSMFHLMLM